MKVHVAVEPKLTTDMIEDPRTIIECMQLVVDRYGDRVFTLITDLFEMMEAHAQERRDMKQQDQGKSFQYYGYGHRMEYATHKGVIMRALMAFIRVMSDPKIYYSNGAMQTLASVCLWMSHDYDEPTGAVVCNEHETSFASWIGGCRRRCGFRRFEAVYYLIIKRFGYNAGTLLVDGEAGLWWDYFAYPLHISPVYQSLFSAAKGYKYIPVERHTVDAQDSLFSLLMSFPFLNMLSLVDPTQLATEVKDLLTDMCMQDKRRVYELSLNMFEMSYVQVHPTEEEAMKDARRYAEFIGRRVNMLANIQVTNIDNIIGQLKPEVMALIDQGVGEAMGILERVRNIRGLGIGQYDDWMVYHTDKLRECMRSMVLIHCLVRGVAQQVFPRQCLKYACRALSRLNHQMDQLHPANVDAQWLFDILFHTMGDPVRAEDTWVDLLASITETDSMFNFVRKYLVKAYEEKRLDVHAETVHAREALLQSTREQIDAGMAQKHLPHIKKGHGVRWEQPRGMRTVRPYISYKEEGYMAIPPRVPDLRSDANALMGAACDQTWKGVLGK